MSKMSGLRARVVYESMFGNTEWIALAVAEGLRLEGFETTVANVAEAGANGDEELLVVGAPTHAFSLSRESTREDAVKQGAPAEAAATGLREWLVSKPEATGSPLAAAFDTRVRKVKHLPTAASRKAAHLLHKVGYDVVASHGFLVEDVAGPLVDGQLESATSWGRELGVTAQSRLAAGSTR